MDEAESFEQPSPAPQNTPESDDLQESQLHINLELAPGTRLHVTLDSRAPDGSLLDQHSLTLENPAPPAQVEAQEPDPLTTPQPRSRLPWKKVKWDLPLLLLAGVLIVYLITRLTGLAQFPIYFFTDEAIQTVMAADLVRDGFRGETGEFLPTFFKNGGQYNLSLSVYLQVIPTLGFGKSVFVTRVVSVFISLLAVLGVGLTLRNGFKSTTAWAGALLLAVTPVWFLHSRTAFETVLAVSFYAAFIYCYIMYRQGRIGYLYAAIVFAALTFYSYSPGQMVILATALLLLLSDLRFHWQQRKSILHGLILALILAIPYLRFQINHPGETLRHLQILDSYWVQDHTLGEKFTLFLRQYLQGINPGTWYDPTPDGLVRHIMKGYSYLWLPGLPFVALGLVLSAIRVRQAEYRVVLAALLAAPTGSALVGVGVTRLLFIVIPAALLGGIGFSAAVEWLVARFRSRLVRGRVLTVLSLLIFIAMSAVGFAMLNDALVNGPTWFDDYGLGGMQYGGEHLFSEIRDYLAENPEALVSLSPSWANGTDVIARFFFDDPLPFRLGSIEGYLQQYIPIDPNEVFILLPEEMDQVQQSGKFQSVVVDHTVDYPNGQPGFYFTRLTYVDEVEAIFAAERDERRALAEELIPLPDGSVVNAAYSHLDMGSIDQAFDDNLSTLVRTYEANPFKINLDFDRPRTMRGLRLRIGGVPSRVTVLAYSEGESLPRNFTIETGESPAPQMVDIDFMEEREITALHIDILNIRDREPAHVHLWEVQFR